MLTATLSRSTTPTINRRATLTIVTHGSPAGITGTVEPEESEVPAGWKTCFACKGKGTKGGLWVAAGRHGTRKCDVCDGNRVVPENEPEPTSDVSAHYGYPEQMISPSCED